MVGGDAGCCFAVILLGCYRRSCFFFLYSMMLVLMTRGRMVVFFLLLKFALSFASRLAMESVWAVVAPAASRSPGGEARGEGKRGERGGKGFGSERVTG